MKKKNNFFSWLLGKMKHNWGLKLLSLFFAILLWNSAVVDADPVRPQTYSDIPITVVGSEQLAEKDLALVDSISSYAKNVKVTVNINRSQISNYDETSIGIQLDLSRINGVGPHEIRLISTSANVDKIEPASITVEVDERANRVIPVECEVVGTLSEGYHRGPLEVSPNAIQVEGAKSIVEKIEKAYTRLDITDKTESVNVPKEYTFIDSTGSAIEASALKVSFDSVVLKMSITPKKTLLISPTVLGQDGIKEGYQIADIVADPSTVVVTGDAELLEGLTSVQLEGIQIAAGQYENVFMQDLKIQVPTGITVLGVDTASVLVQIEEIMSEKEFENVEVELRNVPEGLKAVDFSAQVNIKVIAPATIIDNLAANHITVYVDMTGAEAGDSTLPLLYEAPEDYRVANVIFSQETVNVTLE